MNIYPGEEIKEFNTIGEDGDIYEEPFTAYGLYAPWSDEPSDEHIEYTKRHSDSMLGIFIYLMLAGIILVFTIGRYGYGPYLTNDYIYWTFQLLAIIWVAAGVAFGWYLWIHGRSYMSIGLWVLFIIIYILAVLFVLEPRYQAYKSFAF